MTETEAIRLFKCLADKSRLQILKSLAMEDMYVERLAERLLDAGASVNDAEYSPDSSVLLEALNVKAAPEIIRLLVARGADTSREGEVFDAKSGETFRGNAAQLAAARGYGVDVIGLLK